MQVGAVILAGGHSRRMGSDKALLPFAGSSFIARIARELTGFNERLLSVGTAPAPALPGFTPVFDVHPDCGPIAGLHAALLCCRCDALLAVSCDLPLFSCALAEHLAAQLPAGSGAAVPVTRDGRIHPLCAIYRRSCAAVFSECLQQGALRMTQALTALDAAYIPLEESPFSDRLLTNVNTPAAYAALLAAWEGVME